MTILQKETEQIKKAFDDLRISAAYDPMVKLALEKAEGALRSLLIATADKIEKQAQEIEEQKHAAVAHLVAMLMPGEN